MNRHRARTRVLFIARAYPPTIGGMENFAFRLREHLAEHADVTTIVNHRGKRALPAFLPLAAMVAIRKARSGEVEAVHLADALLAPVGAAIKHASGVPVSASVCGLDVTFANRAYQAVIPRALRTLDLVMPISSATEAAMRDRTGPNPRSKVIPLGVNRLAEPGAGAVARFARHARLRPEERVVLTVGRLVARKGAAWFAGNVLPRLGRDAVYVVVGEGPEREAIVRAADAAGVGDRLRLPGRVDQDLLAGAYCRAEVFVMPNVPVPGDMEGFGLVALEAAAAGLPVVAADLEGIADAVQHGRNGILCLPRDAGAFASAITELLDLSDHRRRALGARFATFTRSEYSWSNTAERYARAIDGLVDPVTTRIAA